MLVLQNNPQEAVITCALGVPRGPDTQAERFAHHKDHVPSRGSRAQITGNRVIIRYSGGSNTTRSQYERRLRECQLRFVRLLQDCSGRISKISSSPIANVSIGRYQLSPRQISEALGSPLPNTGHHIQIL